MPVSNNSSITLPKTIDVDIQNFSPLLISEAFTSNLRLNFLKALEKKGFAGTPRDKANYMMMVFLKVDTYYVYGKRIGPIGANNYRSMVTKNQMSPHGMQKTNQVLELAMDYQLLSTTDGKRIWDFADGIYFFGDEKKDLKRSIGMARFVAGNIR